MPSCAFTKCHNNSNNSNKAKGVTFHMFPRQPGERGKWIEILREDKRDDKWMPKNYSRVCSAHFDGDMFYMTNAGQTKLKHFAVPSSKTRGETRQSLPAPNEALEQTPRTGRPRWIEPRAPSASPLLSPVRPRGLAALPCQPMKVTSGPSPVLQKCQVETTLDPVITGIKSEADTMTQVEDGESDDTLSLADETDQLSEDLIPLSNAQVPLSNALDPLSDVKVEELEVNRSVEVARAVEVPTVPLPCEDLSAAENDSYRIHMQAKQIKKLRVWCGEYRQKLRNYAQMLAHRNRKISGLQAELQDLKNFIAERGWDAMRAAGGKPHSPMIQIQSKNKSVVEKKYNRQLLIVKRNYNRPKLLGSAQPTSDILQTSVGVNHTPEILQKSLLDAINTSDNRQNSSVGVKSTLNIQEKSSVGIPSMSDVLENSTVGVKPTSDILQKSLLDALNTSDNRQNSSVGVKRTLNIKEKLSDSIPDKSDLLQKPAVGFKHTLNIQEKLSVGIPDTPDVLQKSTVGIKRTLDIRQKSSVAAQGTSSIPKSSLAGNIKQSSDRGRQTSAIVLKSSSGIPGTSNVRKKISDGVESTSDTLKYPSIAVQPISDIPPTSAVGFQRTSDIRQNALVIQIDGMSNTVLQPKLVKLDGNGMETS